MKKKVISILLIICCIFIGYRVYANITDSSVQINSVGGSNSQDGVEVSKTIEGTSLENYFDITLTVKTKSKIEEILKDQDLAVVIVMDISNSMVDSKVDGDSGDTRLVAAQKAGKKLIESFATNSTGVNAKREIGYVAFNSNATKVFDLQSCTTTDCNALNGTYKGKYLGDVIKQATDQIIKDNLVDGKYFNSKNRFTNIEAGLSLANTMLNNTDIENKYVIFISDGYPTTYIKSGYNGYVPYTPNATTSGNGQFYNVNLKKPCSYGTDYSNIGAKKAEEMATAMKNSGTKIFTIGTGIKYQKTIQTYLDNFKNEKFTTIDTDSSTYVIGSPNDNDKTEFKAWLQNKIGSGYYYDTNDEQQMIEAYNKIFEKIKELKEEESKATWVANDPMNMNSQIKNIEFIGMYDENNNLVDSVDKENGNYNTATFLEASDNLQWDLKNSTYEEETINNETTYSYSIKYKVRLTNESEDFIEKQIYNTNGTTTLSYVLRVNGELSDNKTIDFPIPSVLGYLGEFNFYKTSKVDGSKLEGAIFNLVHDENCACHNERKYANIKVMSAVSDKNGLVSFSSIPSGHTYKLIEISAPENHIIDNIERKVTVAYNSTSVENLLIKDLADGNKEKYIENEPEKGKVTISKFVVGESTNQKFVFNIELIYNGNPLSGTYNNIEFDNNGKATIKLGHDDIFTFDTLPVGTILNISEQANKNYSVQYSVNETDIENKSFASINIENIDKKIDFINFQEYILPDTGGIGNIILVITGSILFMSPVIYIIYTHLRKAKR